MNRVKKSGPVVWARSSGATRRPVKKVRVWSKVIRAITAPRSKSTQVRRDGRILASGSLSLQKMTMGSLQIGSTGASESTITGTFCTRIPIFVGARLTRRVWNSDGRLLPEGYEGLFCWAKRQQRPNSTSAGVGRDPSIARVFGMRRHDGCSETFLRGLIGRTSFELRERRRGGRIRSRYCREARPE